MRKFFPVRLPRKIRADEKPARSAAYRMIGGGAGGHVRVSGRGA